jgi:hypothetical protein
MSVPGEGTATLLTPNDDTVYEVRGIVDHLVILRHPDTGAYHVAPATRVYLNGATCGMAP